MPRKAAGLPANKVALVHVARRRLGMNDDDYRSVLRRIAGVESACDLTAATFGQVMEEFARLGFTSDRASANLGRRPGMATPGQVATIRDLWHDFTGGEGTDLTLGRWLAKHWGISHLRFLPAVLAPKAIGALRAMNARRATMAKAS